MKTDTTLQVEICGGTLLVKHKTLMVESSPLFAMISAERIRCGNDPISLATWRKTRSATEYIQLLESKGIEAVKASRGKGKSYVHLKVAIRAAMDGSPEFADAIIDSFLGDKLADLRDRSGDDFIDLNQSLKDFGEEVLGKPAHNGHFIQLAKTIRNRCELDGPWESATAQQHITRSNIERSLSSMLRMRVVRDWDHLKELAEIV